MGHLILYCVQKIEGGWYVYKYTYFIVLYIFKFTVITKFYLCERKVFQAKIGFYKIYFPLKVFPKVCCYISYFDTREWEKLLGTYFISRLTWAAPATKQISQDDQSENYYLFVVIYEAFHLKYSFATVCCTSHTSHQLPVILFSGNRRKALRWNTIVTISCWLK